MKRFIFVIIYFFSVSLYAENNVIPSLYSFSCPKAIGHDKYSLTHTGTQIVGFGKVTFGTLGPKLKIKQPYFTYSIPIKANIPRILAKGFYSNNAIYYDPHTGLISCNYVSKNFDSFTMVYQLNNGCSGSVEAREKNKILISFGLH